MPGPPLCHPRRRICVTASCTFGRCSRLKRALVPGDVHPAAELVALLGEQAGAVEAEAFVEGDRRVVWQSDARVDAMDVLAGQRFKQRGVERVADARPVTSGAR
jgi:hypothetical protein